MTKQGKTASLPRIVFAGRFAEGEDVSWHTHPCAEIVLVTDGRCRIAAGETWLDLSPGDLCVLPAGVPQYQETLAGACTTYLGIDAGDLFDGSLRTLAMPLADPAARWMEDLCDLVQEPSGMGSLQAGALLLAVLDRIGRHEARHRTMSALHPDLARAVAYLDENFAETLTVDDIADHAHLSASHLTALFRTRFSCGPLHYQQRLRMRQARSLLSDPYLSIGEIARRCGYEDTGYFIRLFRRLHGRPPGKWRGEPGEASGMADRVVSL
jgi:AraC-like DNA-binding protein